MKRQRRSSHEREIAWAGFKARCNKGADLADELFDREDWPAVIVALHDYGIRVTPQGDFDYLNKPLDGEAATFSGRLLVRMMNASLQVRANLARAASEVTEDAH